MKCSVRINAPCCSNSKNKERAGHVHSLFDGIGSVLAVTEYSGYDDTDTVCKNPPKASVALTAISVMLKLLTLAGSAKEYWEQKDNALLTL